MTQATQREEILQTIDPSSIKRIHLLGVCGTGMGAFAGMLAAKGYAVTGCDENVYPPMSDMLKAWGIETMTGYRAENLARARPDLVIVGNVIRRENPEAAALRASGLPHMSFPAALGSLCIGARHGVVVVGTHGKTTTTALIAHLLVHAGRDPSLLVGGVALNQGANFRIGAGDHFVVEGDEYDTAYFDKGPKFLHYRPRSALFTSMELDHADIYRDEAHYRSAFERFAAIMPAEGYLAVSAAWPGAVEVARRAGCRVETYLAPRPGVAAREADWLAANVASGPEGNAFDILHRGQRLCRVELPLSGAHNVENALGAFAVATALGLSPTEIAAGFASFKGVKRRQEVRGEPNGVLVIDDFAHHPTAVAETIAGIRARYGARRLWAIFEPRSNTSRRNLHQQQYGTAFDQASRALICAPAPTDKVPASERLDVAALVEAISRRGVEAWGAPSPDAIVDRLTVEARPGDVLLVMSNGAFGGLIEKLLARLAT